MACQSILANTTGTIIASQPAASAGEGSANAQSTIIVTADRQSEPLLRATASVDVVTSADDRLAGHQLFAFDWLRDLAGVDVIQSSGGLAGATQLRLRGAGAAETKVLEDGIPVADPSGISGNPQIELLVPPEVSFHEGCLSLPGFMAVVPRAKKVRVTCLDERGKPRTIEASGWYARILQHEIDHLHGRIYIDRMQSETFTTLENYQKNQKK